MGTSMTTQKLSILIALQKCASYAKDAEESFFKLQTNISTQNMDVKNANAKNEMIKEELH